MSLSEDSLLTFNGIDGSTGEYLQHPLPVEQVSRLARGERIDEGHLSDLRWRRRLETEKHYGVIEGIDPKDLAQTGWGVIFPQNADPAIREALRPLLDLRREQASAKNDKLYREFIDQKAAYRPEETKPAFLNRHGAGGAGAVDPKNVPYYLLLVGDPESIPFRFQYQLDVQYAVGRIHFDTLDDYARYAESVVAAETGKIKQKNRAAFFRVANPDDMATTLSSTHLVAPLAEFARGDQPSWSVEAVDPEQATKAKLAALLGGDEAPSFLFTASHGMGFPNGHSRQAIATGALLCQDWPGPKAQCKMTPDFYFGAEDLGSDARLAGLIAMFFACYGGGSPKYDDFSDSVNRKVLAPSAFVSALPKRLLAHSKGGALAVIGHVDRAWGYSFYWNRSGRQLQVFQSAIKRLMEGHPVGSALEYFNSRYAELGADLSAELQEIKDGKRPNDYELSGMWTSNNDARNYTVIGDPAVRIRLNGSVPAGNVQREAPVVVSDSAASNPLRELTTLPAVVARLAELVEAPIEVTTQAGGRQAVTEIKSGGETDTVLPTTGAEVDETLARVHVQMVEKALAHRAAILAQLIAALKKDA